MKKHFDFSQTISRNLARVFCIINFAAYKTNIKPLKLLGKLNKWINAGTNHPPELFTMPDGWIVLLTFEHGGKNGFIQLS